MECTNESFTCCFHSLSVPPKVELSLGRNLNPKDLEEGDDIYFSCSVEANPPAYKITWWHNVSLAGIALTFHGQPCLTDVFFLPETQP